MASIVHTADRFVVLQVGKYKVVSGLRWHLLTQPRYPMAEARKIAQRQREKDKQAIDVVALRTTESAIQAGFVVRDAGASKGMYSLATVAADLLGRDFIAALPLDEGMYATVVVIGGAISPNTDQVLSAQDARRAVGNWWSEYSSDVSKSGRELVIYCPSEIDPSGTPYSLEELFKSPGKKHRLRRLSWFSKQEIATALITTGVIVVAVVVGTSYLKSKADARRMEQLRIEQERERIRLESGRSAEKIALSHPWSAQPNVATFAETCIAELRKLPLSVAGWPLDAAGCSASKVSAKYLYHPGSDVRSFGRAAEAWKSDIAIHGSPDGAFAGFSFGVSMRAGGDDPLPEIDPLVADFQAAMQVAKIGFVLTIQESTFPPGYMPMAGAGLPEFPDWSTRKWIVSTTKRSPANYLDRINALGVRADAITLEINDEGLVWSASGELYGK